MCGKVTGIKFVPFPDPAEIYKINRRNCFVYVRSLFENYDLKRCACIMLQSCEDSNGGFGVSSASYAELFSEVFSPSFELLKKCVYKADTFKKDVIIFSEGK